MDIYEFADIINRELDIKRYPNQDNRWTCQFKDCMCKDGKSMLLGEYGDAKTPIGAVQNYTYKIRGKTIVLSPNTSQRIEYVVPKNIISPIQK